MKYCRQSQNRSCDLSRFQTNYYARMGLITQRYLYILGIALQWNMTITRLQVFIKRDYVEIVGYKNLLVYVTLCMTYFNTRKYYFLNPSIFPCFNFIYVGRVLFMKFTPFEEIQGRNVGYAFTTSAYNAFYSRMDRQRQSHGTCYFLSQLNIMIARLFVRFHTWLFGVAASFVNVSRVNVSQSASRRVLCCIACTRSSNNAQDLRSLTLL